MKVDFRTISPEDFEFLCEALLRAKKFTIESRPARGPDGGKDILAVRDVTDDMGIVHRERWLVECKHLGESNRSVVEGDVGSIELRMKRHNANRYLLVASTIVSETVKEQLKALSEDQSSPRMATFWAKNDLLKWLRDFPDVRDRFLVSWEKEAREAALLLNNHYFQAHRGAILWCPGITAIFGNDGYAPVGHESDEATLRAQNEVEAIRALLKERRTQEIAFNTTPDGYSWVILADTTDARGWNDLIWTCYPPGGSSDSHTKNEAMALLWKFMSTPVKEKCAVRS
jgi:hypothetical protein